MNVFTLRQIVTATLLVTGVVMLCSATPLVERSRGLATAHERERPALRAFQKHRQALRDSIVHEALSHVGTPYRFGGTTPEGGFDCSGLVQFVFARFDLEPPRTAARQARLGAAVQREELRPGDLLTFGVGDSVTHIGIYVGDRKYVHASSVAGRIILSPLDRPPSPLIRPMKGARRLLAISDPLAN
jgi:cell wall-associated NlpC family hydrolase